MSHWVAIGPDAQGFLGYALEGESVVTRAQGPDRAAVLARLGRPGAAVVGIDEGAPAPLPAPVLPSGGRELPALSQDKPADLISGWVRVRVADYLAPRPHWDGVICALHGDVTHWLHLSAAEVISSRSSLTQRLSAALQVGEAPPDAAAIADSLSRPERLVTDLRAATLAGDAAACLGHLLGAELAATRAYWLGQQVAVIGPGDMPRAYAEALRAQGVPVECTAPPDLLPDGLAALARALRLV